MEPMSRPLRVLHYIDTPNFAGTERHILELAAELHKQGVEVCVACPANSILADKARAVQLSLVAIEGQRSFNWPAIRAMRRLLKSGAVDVLHAHNGRTALSCAIAAKLARRGHVIATQHFIDPAHLSRTGLAARLVNQVHHWVHGAVDHFLANSEAARSAMLERGDAPSEKITTTPLGISEPNPQSLKDSAAVRHELGIEPDTPLIVCVARLEKEKDIGTLIDAMVIVLQTNPRAVCGVAGEGDEKEALLSRIKAASIEKNMRLLGFQSDALSLIHAGDVFVLPSLAEPFGLVLLEAMALGKPVVATRAGGPQEIVLHDETGLLVPPSSPPAMATAIVQLLTDAETREEMGRQGLHRFHIHYTTERMASSTIAAYRIITSHK
jgi:glycosyltransferase involved in cell wall biosynthesis